MFPLYRIIRACNPWVNRCIAKLDGVGPGHILHREIVRSLEIARGLPHHRMVLALRHLMNAKAERLGDPYPMLGLLIGTRFSIGFRRAHEEFPRLDADELHADRVGDKLRGRGGRRWGHRRLRAGRVGGSFSGAGAGVGGTGGFVPLEAVSHPPSWVSTTMTTIMPAIAIKALAAPGGRVTVRGNGTVAARCPVGVVCTGGKGNCVGGTGCRFRPRSRAARDGNGSRPPSRVVRSHQGQCLR